MPVDEYLTLAERAAYELPRMKGSRFLAEAFPARDEAEAEAHVEAVRSREHAATHHVFAYRLGPEAETVRSSDDGEPSGSAGVPVLRQIEGRGLSDVLVVVTRYYGGTKLGTGGLARAYAAAAAGALDTAPVATRTLRVPVRLRFDYADTAPALHVLRQFDVENIDACYQARTELLVQVRRSQAEAFVEAFTDALGGRGEAEQADGLATST